MGIACCNQRGIYFNKCLSEPNDLNKLRLERRSTYVVENNFQDTPEEIDSLAANIEEVPCIEIKKVEEKEFSSRKDVTINNIKE